MFNFVWHYALPVALFVYCYGRILHVIIRRRTILGVQVDRSHPDDALRLLLRNFVAQPAAATTRSPAIAEGPRDARVPVEIW